MNTTDFYTPEKHPHGMLEGYDNAYQKEALLAHVLEQSIVKLGIFAPIPLKHSHPAMVKDGLLVEHENGYTLTVKSMGLLFSKYGREGRMNRDNDRISYLLNQDQADRLGVQPQMVKIVLAGDGEKSPSSLGVLTAKEVWGMDGKYIGGTLTLGGNREQ